MKNSKKLKLILQILICVLIILIGVVGIYTRNSNIYTSILPKYILGSDINGATILELEVDDSKETIYYDKDGNEVDSTKITEKNKNDYTKKEVPVNLEEDLNIDNYNEVLDIMEKRLKFIQVNQYQLDLDKETGKISLTVEDDHIDDIETFLPMEGKLQFVDSNTEDIVIDYTDFELAEASYASLTNEVRIFIHLNLNDAGIEKIKNIDKYNTTEPKEASEENDEEPKESKLIVMFDNEKMSEVSYDDILVNGKSVRLTTATGLTDDNDVNSQININAVICRMATIGKLPITYNITAEEFLKNDIGNNINYIIVGLIAISIIASIVLVVKYKLRGLLAVIGFATNISIFLIVIRYTKVQVSLNGLTGLIGLVILNVILANNILKSLKEKDKVFIDNIKRAYINTLDVIVIILIIFIIFSFSSMTVINTMGLLLFWGWIITILGNLIFAVPMLATVTKK